MPTCKSCGEGFPNRQIIDGKLRYLGKRKYCLICSPFGKHNTKRLDGEEDKRRRRDTIAKSVVRYRKRVKIKSIEYLGGKCYICGYSKCIEALHFHHLDPSQKMFNISGSSYSWDRIRNELNKCILLCANCHAEVEYGYITLG